MAPLRMLALKTGTTGHNDTRTVTFVDYNNDGWLDIFSSHHDFYVYSNTLLRSNNGNNFTNVANSMNISGEWMGDYFGVGWADYNNDGIEDLFIIGETVNGNPISHLYSNNRTANFKRIPLSIPGYYDGSVEWGDYDRDGDFDLLITGNTKNRPAK